MLKETPKTGGIEVVDLTESSKIEDCAGTYLLYPLHQRLLNANTELLESLVNSCKTDKGCVFYKVAINGSIEPGKPVSITMTAYGSKQAGVVPHVKNFSIPNVETYKKIVGGWAYFASDAGVGFLLEKQGVN